MTRRPYFPKALTPEPESDFLIRHQRCLDSKIKDGVDINQITKMMYDLHWDTYKYTINDPASEHHGEPLFPVLQTYAVDKIFSRFWK